MCPNSFLSHLYLLLLSQTTSLPFLFFPHNHQLHSIELNMDGYETNHGKPKEVGVIGQKGGVYGDLFAFLPRFFFLCTIFSRLNCMFKLTNQTESEKKYIVIFWCIVIQSPSVAEACSHDSAGTNDTQHNLQSKNCHETDDWDGNEDASDQDGDDYLTDLFEAELTPRKKLSKRARSLFVIEMPGTINCPRWTSYTTSHFARLHFIFSKKNNIHKHMF